MSRCGRTRREFLSAATLILTLFLETLGSAQANQPQSQTANAQSVGLQGETTDDSCLLAPEMEQYPNCVLRDEEGKLFIAQGYVKNLKFDTHGLAIAFHDNHSPNGWMYVDRKGRVIIQGVPGADNWADEFADGLVRTVINGKYGFADRQGRLVVAAKYDWAAPFEHGYAKVCMGCRETCVKPDNMRTDSEADCEHQVVTGGEWFKINKAGRVVERIKR